MVDDVKHKFEVFFFVEFNLPIERTWVNNNTLNFSNGYVLGLLFEVYKL